MLRVAEGKRLLLAREYDGAATALSRANEYFGTLKLRTVILGVRFLPGIVRWLAERSLNREINGSALNKLSAQETES